MLPESSELDPSSVHSKQHIRNTVNKQYKYFKKSAFLALLTDSFLLLNLCVNICLLSDTPYLVPLAYQSEADHQLLDPKQHHQKSLPQFKLFQLFKTFYNHGLVVKLINFLLELQQCPCTNELFLCLYFMSVSILLHRQNIQFLQSHNKQNPCYCFFINIFMHSIYFANTKLQHNKIFWKHGLTH